MRFWLLLFFLLVTSSIFAESKIPLLSPRSTATSDPLYGAAPEKDPLYFGVELGVLARTDGMAGTVAGMQLLYGGRAFLLIPLNSHWALKPSLGYFQGGQSLAGVSVTQQDIEPGVTAEYTMTRTKGFQWWVGGVDRVEVLFSTITVLNSSGTGVPAIRDRLGPATGVAFHFLKGIDFTVDAETAASVTLPIRFYPAVTAGVLMRW